MLQDRLEPNALAGVLADYLVRHPYDPSVRNFGMMGNVEMRMGGNSVLGRLGSMANRIDSAEVDRIAEILCDALTREKDSKYMESLTNILMSFMDRLAPSKVSKLCESGGRAFAASLGRELEPRTSLIPFMPSMLKFADRMSPAGADEVCGHAARLLQQGFRKRGG